MPNELSPLEKQFKNLLDEILNRGELEPELRDRALVVKAIAEELMGIPRKNVVLNVHNGEIGHGSKMGGLL